MIGTWKLVSVIDFADIAAVDETQAARLVGQTVTISDKQVTFGERECSSPSFSAERVRRDRELRENARISEGTLDLPDPVTIVDVACAFLYLKDRDHVVFAWNGAFFDAARIKP